MQISLMLFDSTTAQPIQYDEELQKYFTITSYDYIEDHTTLKFENSNIKQGGKCNRKDFSKYEKFVKKTEGLFNISVCF